MNHEVNEVVKACASAKATATRGRRANPFFAIASKGKADNEDAELAALSIIASDEIPLKSNPTNPTNLINPSSDNEGAESASLSIFARDEIPLKSNPTNPTNLINPSSDNEDAESASLSIFARDEFQPNNH